MNVVMIGTGYVGLTTGLGYASLGHRVACVDKDPQKIANLDVGKPPFYEPGLPEALKKHQEAGNIMFTTDLSAVIGEADVIILAVQTPSTITGEADLTYLLGAAEEIGALLDHEALIITKSTVPVGTNRKVLAAIREALRKNNRSELESLIQIASVPEFLREGTALDDFLKSERTVVGADDEIVFATAEKLHEGIDAPMVKTTIESAEMIKYASNAFLATKISFINEIANIAELNGADVRDIAKGIGLDSRIGSKFLRAGIGYGGSCFPKDVSALRHIAGHSGYEFKLLNAVMEVNEQQRELFLKKIQRTLGNLKGRRIGVWGLAFKPGTDDTRKSAAIDIVRALVGRGAEVTAYDPQAVQNAKQQLPESVVYAPTPIDAAEGVDALLVLTEWPEFKTVSFPTLKARMVAPIVFDGRNFLADQKLERFGFAYYGVGLCPSDEL